MARHRRRARYRRFAEREARGRSPRCERFALGVAGDRQLLQLLELVGPVVADAPADATVVVFHAAALVYLPEPGRRRFAELMAELPAVWISAEGPGVVPAWRPLWSRDRRPSGRCSCSGRDPDGWLGWPTHTGHGCNGSTVTQPAAPDSPSRCDRAQP